MLVLGKYIATCIETKITSTSSRLSRKEVCVSGGRKVTLFGYSLVNDTTRATFYYHFDSNITYINIEDDESFKCHRFLAIGTQLRICQF